MDKTNAATLAQQAQLEQLSRDEAASLAMEGTEAGKIWNAIKNLEIHMFALPSQVVCMHAHPVVIEPSKLYLLTNSSSVLPALETAIGKNYKVELADKFVIISKAEVSLTK